MSWPINNTIISNIIIHEGVAIPDLPDTAWLKRVSTASNNPIHADYSPRILCQMIN